MRWLVLKFILGIFFLILPEYTSAQFLENFFSDRNIERIPSTRDDFLSSNELVEELTFVEVICRDKNKFPQLIESKTYQSYAGCKESLDRIQEATYIDLTFRIRRDADRLDIFDSGIRKIYICDGRNLNVYAHDQNQDPDWWMIVRNSLDYVECDDEISIETLD